MTKVENFSEFGLPAALADALKALEFTVPTPIQAAAIPPAMLGKDILAIAPTGTGKTGAFSIPIAHFLYPQPGKQVLILAPTRELAAQIHRFFRKLGDALDLQGVLIVGGESFGRQKKQVKLGVDYIIATPGRLNDHIQQGMPTGKIGILVLDEVDRMLDMGFAPQVEEIVQSLGPERQTFLFSATLPPEIVGLANKYLKDPVRVNVLGNPAEAPKIHEERIDTTDAEKPGLLVEEVAKRTGKIIVFANTQGRVEQVTRRLEQSGHPAQCIHGARTHRERKSALDAFRSGEVRILVATDIVARGIDVADIEHVINFDYPATKEDYLHRIGRTGRIGKEGSAVTFVDARRKRMSDRNERFSRGRSQNGSFGSTRGPKPFGRPAASGRAEAGPGTGERPAAFSRPSGDRGQGFGRPSGDRGQGFGRPSGDRGQGFGRPSGDRGQGFGRPSGDRGQGFGRPSGDRGQGFGRPSGDRGQGFGRPSGDRGQGFGRPSGDRGQGFGRPSGDRGQGFGRPSAGPRPFGRPDSRGGSFGRKPFGAPEEGPHRVGGTRTFRAGEDSGRPAPAPRRAFGPKPSFSPRPGKAGPGFVRSGSGAVRRGRKPAGDSR
jgi:superfamily II DNA/RNA helicase